ncbi:retrovirus-related pol polyprotein from transposon tnt 1-94, partial [Nicotiana attenuata]
MKYAAYVINMMPLSPNNMKSPYELMFGEKSSVKHLRVFGSISYVRIPDSQQSKLDAKERKCIFIGYDERKKGWKYMDPKTNLFVVSRDVIFDEVSLYYGVEKEGQ